MSLSNACVLIEYENEKWTRERERGETRERERGGGEEREGKERKRKKWNHFSLNWRTEEEGNNELINLKKRRRRFRCILFFKTISKTVVIFFLFSKNERKIKTFLFAFRMWEHIKTTHFTFTVDLTVSLLCN